MDAMPELIETYVTKSDQYLSGQGAKLALLFLTSPSSGRTYRVGDLEHIEAGGDLEDAEGLVVRAVVQDVNLEIVTITLLDRRLMGVEVRVPVFLVWNRVGHEGHGRGEGQALDMHCCCFVFGVVTNELNKRATRKQTTNECVPVGDQSRAGET